jgi:hypothetical protein
MQPITCEACRQPTVAHDVVNYGSMEGGYRQLCDRCFNEAAASRLGLQGFEHVVFEPVRMVDGRGAEHDFRFRTRLFGPGVAIDAFELRDGSPAGYEFQVIGEPDEDSLEGPSSFRVEPNSQNRWSSSSPVGMWAGCL